LFNLKQLTAPDLVRKTAVYYLFIQRKIKTGSHFLNLLPTYSVLVTSSK